MNQVLIRLVIWIAAYIIQWLIEKRREHINQNRNAVINGVAKN
jgi:phage shock protein PspC (stress-responsive transcriptional regulator)